MEFLYNEKEKRNKKLKIHVKVLDTGLSETEKDKFIDDFSPISDSINIDTLTGWSNSNKMDFTIGMADKIRTGMDGKNPLKTGRKVCPEPFKTMAINFNGSVSVCCADWSWGAIIGDARDERLLNIWNGNRLKTFRLLQLRGERSKITPCGNCQYMQGINPLSDIDEYAEELLEVYDEVSEGYKYAHNF